MSRLTHDINQYGVMIQPKANTTLKAMTKAELIEYIRTLEHNYNVAVDFNERQARNVEAELKKWQHYKDLEEQGRLIEQKYRLWEYGDWNNGHWVKGNKKVRCTGCHRVFDSDPLIYGIIVHSVVAR